MAYIDTITSMTNLRVKSIMALAMKKARVDSGLFVVEGLQLVGFGVDAGWELDTLVFRDGENEAHKAVLNRALQATKYALAVNGHILEKLTRKDNPQGVIGVFKQRTVALKDVALDGGVWVVLEQVRDPGNLGTVIRTVDAVGAKGVILVGNCTDPWSMECLRATMGSIFHVPVAVTGVESFLTWKRNQEPKEPGTTGVTMVGTHLKGDVDYRDIAGKVIGKGVLLAMGTEQSGLSEDMAAACDVLTKIAMRGGAESLNLAIATGVMLYEIFREVRS